MLMLAVQYCAVGDRPRLVEVSEPECPADGVVVSVRATGVCRSDWHAWRGHDPVPLPMTPGHEFAGVIAAVGSAVSGFAVGERVTAPFVHACGRCAWCRSGQGQVCPDQTQPGFTHPGSFAELVCVRAADFNLVRLPEQVSYVAAAALGCRFATAYHALTAQARLAADEWLVVFGAGGVGLSAVMIGHAAGARVVVVDPGTSARLRALELGADHALAPEQVADIAPLTGGGAQVSMDAAGDPTAAQASVACLRRRGRHVQVGLLLGEAASSPLPWDLVVSRELTVIGSHGMAAADYPDLLALIGDGRLDPVRLIGREVGLADLPDALMALDLPSSDGITVARRDPA